VDFSDYYLSSSLSGHSLALLGPLPCVFSSDTSNPCDPPQAVRCDRAATPITQWPLGLRVSGTNGIPQEPTPAEIAGEPASPFLPNVKMWHSNTLPRCPLCMPGPGPLWRNDSLTSNRLPTAWPGYRTVWPPLTSLVTRLWANHLGNLPTLDPPSQLEGTLSWLRSRHHHNALLIHHVKTSMIFTIQLYPESLWNLLIYPLRGHVNSWTSSHSLYHFGFVDSCISPEGESVMCMWHCNITSCHHMHITSTITCYLDYYYTCLYVFTLQRMDSHSMWMYWLSSLHPPYTASIQPNIISLAG
jgi:hypothetical protein